MARQKKTPLEAGLNELSDPEEQAGVEEQKELTKAIERIGRGSFQIMRWLLKFLGTNLAELSQGEWMDSRAEIAVFVITDLCGDQNQAPSRNRERASILAIQWIHLKKMHHLKIAQSASKKQAHAIQTAIRGAIEKFLEQREIIISPERIRFQITLPPSVMAGPQLNYLADDHLSVFQYALVGLLRDTGHKLSHCLACQTIYLGERLDQKYCSVKCQNRVGARNFREAKKEKQNIRPESTMISRSNRKMILE